jgi:glycerophosphoryl diester phosphodiesterase
VQEIIAHRGASAYAAEHTLAAYDLAVVQGADVLELDVRCAADGELVVVHDPTLLRTAGDPRFVAELDGATLRELGALALDGVLRRYGRVARFLLDVKDPDPAWEGRLLLAIGQAGVLGRTVVQSFDHGALRRLHDAAPKLPLAALFPQPLPPPRDLRGVATFACGVGPWHGHVDVAFVAAARAQGLSIRPWTVNQPAAIEHLLSLGVDGVITDVPDVAAALRRRVAAAPVAAPPVAA